MDTHVTSAGEITTLGPWRWSKNRASKLSVRGDNRKSRRIRARWKSAGVFHLFYPSQTPAIFHSSSLMDLELASLLFQSSSWTGSLAQATKTYTVHVHVYNIMAIYLTLLSCIFFLLPAFEAQLVGMSSRVFVKVYIHVRMSPLLCQPFNQSFENDINITTFTCKHHLVCF